jgi:hypothetical protein
MYEREGESSDASDGGIEDIFHVGQGISNCASISGIQTVHLGIQPENDGVNDDHIVSKGGVNSRGKQRVRKSRGRTPKKTKYINDASTNEVTASANKKPEDTSIRDAIVSSLSSNPLTQNQDTHKKTGRSIPSPDSASKTDKMSASSLHTPEIIKDSRKRRS